MDCGLREELQVWSPEDLLGIKEIMKKILIFHLVMLAIVINLSGCHKEQQAAQGKQATQTVVATMKSVPTDLFYNGTISPIQIYNVASPSDGVVKELDFKYGQKVKKGDQLLVISSSKLQDDYHTALTNYLKAAEDYNNAKNNFAGTQELYNAKIISTQEYASDKEQYDNAVLSFLSAKIALAQLIKKIPGAQTVQFEKLSAEDITQLSKILEVEYSNLPIIATQDGVALSPQKATEDTTAGTGGGGDSDSDKTLAVGSQVKEGQTLVSIGDLSGLSTVVQVSEMVINQIKPGQAVTVTLEALPNINFKGSVKSVGAQAQPATEGQSGVASFPVTVVVPKVTPDQMQLIRVGMTAKVQITIQNPPQLMIPIAAVHETGGVSMVTIIGPAGKPQEVPVQTGQTTVDQVAITSGLKAGDQVVVPSDSQPIETNQ